MKTTVGTLRKIAQTLLLALGIFGILGSVAGAATTVNVPRIPRTDQEEATNKPGTTAAASASLGSSLLARGRSQERESPTIPSGPFTLSDRASMIG